MIYCNSCNKGIAGEKVVYCEANHRQPVARKGCLGLAISPSWCPKKVGEIPNGQPSPTPR